MITITYTDTHTHIHFQNVYLFIRNVSICLKPWKLVIWTLWCPSKSLLNFKKKICVFFINMKRVFQKASMHKSNPHQNTCFWIVLSVVSFCCTQVTYTLVIIILTHLKKKKSEGIYNKSPISCISLAKCHWSSDTISCWLSLSPMTLTHQSCSVKTSGRSL